MVMQDVNHQLFTESVLDEVILSMEEDDEEENAKNARSESGDVLMMYIPLFREVKNEIGNWQCNSK